MDCLLIGPNGYVSRNIVSLYKNARFSGFTRNMSIDSLSPLIDEAGCIFHTASKQKLENINDDFESNFDLTKYIVDHCNDKRLIYFSSIHANSDSDFGKVKKREEEYIQRNCSNYQILQLPHTFGLFGRPNYNSVFNTFIYLISNGLDITVNTTNKIFNLFPISNLNSYIDFSHGRSFVDNFETIPKTLVDFVHDVYEVKHSNLVLDSGYEAHILLALNYYKND